MTGTEVQKWADKAMFKAAPIDAQSGPEVRLLSCNADPLGTIVAAAKMYKGEYVDSLSEVTDEERRFYLEDTRKNVLAAPLEFVNFHFIISGVTRGFTHQMVRQRTATYTQESTRFAVKEDVPVALPQCLVDTVSWSEWWEKCGGDLFPILMHEVNASQRAAIDEYAERQASPEQLQRKIWDDAVDDIGASYKALINTGMPAEDARGILPTNLLTRINYNTSLRGLLEHSGLRLCTQAQFEWRLVWTKIKEAIVGYGKTQVYEPYAGTVAGHKVNPMTFKPSSAWQFEELAKIFKPICYQKGSCQFQSSIDRACTIRDRVQENAKRGIAPVYWDSEHFAAKAGTQAIKDEEWMLDEASARVSQ